MRLRSQQLVVMMAGPMRQPIANCANGQALPGSDLRRPEKWLDPAADAD